MEITWYGGTCVRLRGREGIVAADAYRSVVGPTGRGLTADIVTYSHPDEATPTRARGRGSTSGSTDWGSIGVVPPTSLESAFMLDAPGEYEVHEVLITGVRTYRDEVHGADRGLNTCFIFELDGLHAAHLGDTGHLLTQEMVGEIGSVDILCVPVGSALAPARAAELVAQLDANLVVPLPVGEDEEKVARDLERFLKEMSVSDPQPVAKLAVTISTLPGEATVVVLESRGRT
jgi:L-ascorbate metabolism protein UlaG (beta-lactamase superfamily)